MTEPRSPIVRLFRWIWTLIVFFYRFSVVLVIALFIFGYFASRSASTPKMEANEPLALIPSGTLVDQIPDDRGRSLLRRLSETKPLRTSVRSLVEALDRAAVDHRVPFAVLKLDDMNGAGLPQLQEIAKAIQRFRAAGKPVYAFGENMDQKQYFLAAQADEISLDPMGSVPLQGFSVYTNYFKDALDKLGIQVNVFRVGEFKSAVEPFERNDMSPEARTANQAWLGDLWKAYCQQVTTARKLPADAIEQYVDNYATGLTAHHGDPAAYAIDSHLVTRLETQAQFRKRLEQKVGTLPDKSSFRQIDASDYLAATADDGLIKHGPNRIGLVVVQGDIVDGESDERSAGGDTISALLDQARRNDDIDAVVLRVNSPGGSVFASEKIRRAVQALRDDDKPVVVSMSTLAASGGYWISMAADQIWAEPTTITGSIGIFGMVPNIADPLNRLGIHTDGIGTTPLAGADRIDRPMSDTVKTMFQAQIDNGYQTFIHGVAKGRDIPVEQVNAIARGRVWSGQAAKDLGLVDDFGGLPEATAAAAKLAKLEPGSYRLEELKPARSVFGEILSQVLGHSDARWSSAFVQLLPNGLLADQVQSVDDALHLLNDPQGVYAYCFCQVSLGGRQR